MGLAKRHHFLFVNIMIVRVCVASTTLTAHQFLVWFTVGRISLCQIISHVATVGLDTAQLIKGAPNTFPAPALPFSVPLSPANFQCLIRDKLDDV